MKNVICTLLFLSILVTNISVANAGTQGKNGKITAKSIGAGALSLFVWPGIGQAVNNQKDDKVITHALLGLTGVFRFWSCYDAVRNRKGGVWQNRV